MQKNDEQEKRSKLDKKHRMKQGVFNLPKKEKVINFKNIVNLQLSSLINALILIV